MRVKIPWGWSGPDFWGLGSMAWSEGRKSKAFWEEPETFISALCHSLSHPTFLQALVFAKFRVLGLVRLLSEFKARLPWAEALHLFSRVFSSRIPTRWLTITWLMVPSSTWRSRREAGGRSRREKPALRSQLLPFCLSCPLPLSQTQETLPCTFVSLLLSLEIQIVLQSFPPHIDQRGLSQAFSSPVAPGIPLCLGLNLRGHFFR